MKTRRGYPSHCIELPWVFVVVGSVCIQTEDPVRLWSRHGSSRYVLALSFLFFLPWKRCGHTRTNAAAFSPRIITEDKVFQEGDRNFTDGHNPLGLG